jgi:hypothetical protein
VHWRSGLGSDGTWLPEIDALDAALFLYLMMTLGEELPRAKSPASWENTAKG